MAVDMQSLLPIRMTHQRGISPDDSTQTFRNTGKNPDSDGLVPAEIFSLDTNSFLHGWNSTGAVWDRVIIKAGSLGVAITDEDGAPFTESNPLPVTFVDSEGDELNDYANSAAVASGASATHNYTVSAAKTLKLSQIEVSGSGKIKAEIMVETGVATGLFDTYWVKYNSSSDPNIELHIDESLSVAAGVRVRVTVSNRDHLAFDIHSTISGHEI